MHLFASCNQLLREIKELGGEDHASIRTAVLEHMADVHLSRVDDVAARRADASAGAGAAGAGGSGAAGHGDGPPAAGAGGGARAGGDSEEDFDQGVELQEGIALLCEAAECLGALVSKEIAVMEARAAAPAPTGPPSAGNSPSRPRRDVGTLVGAPGGAGGGGGGLGDEDDADEDTAIVHTLALQLAGVLHKLFQASLVRHARN